MLDKQHVLIEALTLAREALNAAPELPLADKVELMEIVDSTVDEVQRARPNTRRLLQDLQSIAAAMQRITNGDPTYQTIRAAANASGIPI
jgi:hypothetical protein